MNQQESRNLFSQLIEEHKGIFFKVARAYCPNEADRQDLIQEISIHVWQSLPRYKNQCKISTWLYRISINVAISFYRKSKTTKNQFAELDQLNELVAEDSSAEKEFHLKLLEQFINELKDIDKALMILYLEDKSHSEIAEILGLSISNIATKVARIKEKLKTRFISLK